MNVAGAAARYHIVQPHCKSSRTRITRYMRRLAPLHAAHKSSQHDRNLPAPVNLHAARHSPDMSTKRDFRALYGRSQL
jgi:hypothetical protein